MKNDKKWLRESVNELKTTFNGMKMGEYETGRLDGYSHVSMLIDYLDEPKKPVIPQFVADCIEYYKRAGNSLGELLAHIEYENLLKPKLKMVSKVMEWVYPDDFSDNEDRIDLIARAWLDGYEVEKEKRYFIKEPVTGQFLIRDDSQSRGVKWVDGFSTSPSYFTEAEIKAIDKRYWDFV